MKKLAFIFPGQGAQYIGMAQDFINFNPEFQKILNTFDERSGTDLFSIMKDGPEEILKETKYTQPAILFHSFVAMKTLLKEIDLKPTFVAGHSLGEFSALVANGVLSIEDALHLVHKRGEFMMKANDGSPFAMAAIIGQDSEAVKSFCSQAEDKGIVIAANFNTPVQTVISGSKAGVERACEIAKENGAKRVVPLIVGGPFHSPLIKKAGIWLREEMDKIDFNDTDIPVISNVDAKPTNNPMQIKENLQAQVTSSVLWVDSVNYMINQGIDIFIEFGPKKVLAGMIKKIDRKKKVLSIDTLEDIGSNLDIIKELLDLK
ncbi:MAG: ACP S-malonyltransferase [Candidatus Cloacimonetes bacterium]|nr:ACP S-malonyltransferase [Candidatus Cloacimonadota bacterium]